MIRPIAVEAIQKLLSDQQPIQVTISKAQLWILLSTVQLALRHPSFNGPAAQIARELSDELVLPLIANDREMAKLWAMGKDPQFDA